MSNERLNRPSFFDFQRVTKEDMKSEQSFQLNNTAAALDAVAGSGVLLDFPQEPVVFDSDDLDEAQQGFVAIDQFDGQGILSEPYKATDLVEGNQLSLTLSESRVAGFVNTLVFILGKTFDSSLIYETVEFDNNVTKMTRNHFIEVTNILFQNLRGNTNTSVDGYGCYDVGGRIIVAEAGSMLADVSSISASQTAEPNIEFANFKTAVSGKTLQTTIQEAIGDSNDIDDLDINTTAAQTRLFEEDASSEVIYAQKFLSKTNNIQKVTLLLSLESGSDWSGALSLSIRKLQTSVASGSFLPDDEIGFDPSTEAIEEIFVTQDDLEDMGIILNSTIQKVDFVFSGTNVANPSLSTIEVDTFYALTLRRTGSSDTGTIVLQEATNSDSSAQRLCVFENDVWTDIDDSTLWYIVWTDAAMAASGIAYDKGIRLVSVKTDEGDDGIQEQSFTENYSFDNSGEDVENYLIVQKSVDTTTPKAHPRTGDSIDTREEDVPEFSVLSEDDVVSLLDAGEETVVLARFRDRNARSNPTITGDSNYPCLALGNIFTVISPGSDLLVQNVVGSILTPNTDKPTLRYRITKQTTFTDLYGDTNLDELINTTDAARIAALDGYSTDLNSGSVSSTVQLAAVLGGSVTMSELIRADVSGDVVIDSVDLGNINDFIDDGTALPAGSSFTRIELEVEPVTNQQISLDGDAQSTLAMEDLDSDFTNNTAFSPIPYQIDFVATWIPDNVEVVDLRRFVTTTFIDFSEDDLSSSPESGGLNSLFVPGDLYLTGSVKELDGTTHPLDYEKVVIEIELPDGDTVGEVNIFDEFVVEICKFSDGSLVSSSAINNNQVKFSLSISSYTKDIDGYDISDDGYGNTVDEAVGTYLDHDTGLLRLNCENITNSVLFPELRTRLVLTVELKKAGFNNSNQFIDGDTLTSLLS